MDNNLTPVLNKDNSIKKEPKGNIVGRFFKNVFIKNIGYKALAIVISVALWLITVGFSA